MPLLSRPIGSPPSSTRLGITRSATPMVDVASTAQHFEPPSPRELRAQAVQRLQVGLFGLAAMLLLVGLANVIMQHARQTDPAALVAKSAAGAPGNTDPLVDIGVAPARDAGAPTSGTGAR